MSDGLYLGPLLLRWNGLLIALSIAVGALIAARETKRQGLDPEIIYYLIVPFIIWGTICARLWHILTPPLSSVQLGLTTRYYLSHPVDVLALWIGGFGFPGALMGGLLVLLFFARRNNLSFWRLTDILAPGLALALAIGRLGNYFNQELYGLPTDLPWKIFIEPSYRLVGYEAVEYYHPLFAYEVMLNFAGFILLLWIARRFSEKLGAGDLFLIYLAGYSLIRFFLEFLRLDVALVNGINVNQAFFGVTCVCAGIGLYLKHRPAQEL
jgi:phosphatidylglycerol:prolipoprotein diacylglycerol transferase